MTNFQKVNANYRQANHRTVVLSGVYFPTVDFLSALATAIVLGFGGYLVSGGDMTVGTLFAFIGYLANFFDPVRTCRSSTTRTSPRRRRSTRSWRCSRKSPRWSTAPARSQLPAHLRARPLRGGPVRPTATGPEVIHGLDLDVPPGTTVALVGHTGAGKSTIAKLLARFYDPREGRITIDGHDLSQVTQARSAQQLGIVPQEGFLFAGTLRENIAFGAGLPSRR